MHDLLTQAIEEVDLPGLIARLWPEAGARPGRAGVCRAVWREDVHPSLSLFKARGVWFWKDHATGESGNVYHLLLRAGFSKEETIALLKKHGTTAVHPGARCLHRLGARAPARPEGDRPVGVRSLLRPEGDRPLGARAPARPEGDRPPSEGLTEGERAILRKAQKRLDYKAIRGRGITLAQARALNLGKSQQGDLVIPILGPDGQIRAIKIRLKKPVNGFRYRYLTKGRGSPPWYSPGWGKSPRPVLIVEGELNAIVCWLALRGSMDVLGMPGVGGRLPKEDLQGRQVFLLTDGDEAGERARQRWKEEVGGTILPPLPENMDACEYADKYGQVALGRLLRLGE